MPYLKTWVWMLPAALVACSSTSLPPAGDTAADASANVTPDAGSDATVDASGQSLSSAPDTGAPDTSGPVYDSGPFPDAGCAPVALTGRVPTNHRAAAATCPSQRGAGVVPTSCAYEAGAVGCLQDSDCTQGKNGRCNASGGPVVIPCPYPSCSYDACETDSDCAAKTACDCRSSATDGAPNYCATGSNCAVDSDCGPGGYCSPGGFTDSFCNIPTYFCHTAADTCLDDSDCCNFLPCSFDHNVGHFACGGACAPPP